MTKKGILIFLILLSCNNKDKLDVLEGDIYIKLIDVTNLYGASEELKTSVDNQISSYGSLKGNEDELSINHKKLKEYDLLYSPHFKLKLEDGQIVDVFTSEDEYAALGTYLENLNRDSEKIHLKVQADKKDDRIFYAEKIISIQKLKGKTDWEK